MAGINRNLVLLKLLLFTFYGALSCLMAFLNIHMRFLGLSIQEITWINTVLPLTSLIGPPLVGMLADKLGRYRLITIVCMLLATVLHAALLFVPSCNISTSQASPLTLHCSSEGARLQLWSCPASCKSPVPIHASAFRVDSCHLVCPETVTALASVGGGDGVVVMEGETGSLSNTTTKSSSSSTSSSSRQLLMLLRSSEGATEYIALAGKQLTVAFNTSLMPHEQQTGTAEQQEEEEKQSKQEHPQPEEQKGPSPCHYPLKDFTMQNTHYSSMSCRTQDPVCEVVCSAAKMGNETQLLDTSSCCDPKVTLWLYFSLRSLAEMLSAILVSLLEAVALTMVHQHKGDYGREKMFGLIAVAIFPPLVGYLVDTEVGTFGMYSYAPVFYVFVALMLITSAVTLALPIEVQVQRRSLIKNFIALARTAELSVLLLLMTILGTFWGYLKTFVYFYLEDLDATKMLIGLTSSFCILPSLPFLYKSKAVVQYCGHHYLIMLAFVGYCIRFAGLSYIVNPWWVLLLETLELFTLNLLNVSTATLAYKLAPKTFVATAQALVWVSHFNIGRCIGTFAGGQLLDIYGHVPVFQGAAVIAATCAAVYLAIHQFMKHLKARQTVAQPKPQATRENGNIANGHYTPLQVADDKF
ncbi:uncharacterized protein LOC127004845 [Eriocheir sinensis]|uniref:uncharacterized protein LOC127004845 n=1 Tax=Eriocheir sinensis TaxID=95602 RepID=UPI0021C7DFFD|nr:uncharacterized protein LOC127004845 [Eriocheir sinensis]XP_050728977.1 uncharacterized protein LOC127004845 [Eriocheir sinensis]XP_050728978.1 uncharacterized protein LOC127004845 [Eriocheir sinensis]XP_050728979.1 uncharacterized protein LOC127004845 [Eriocheir sinensis]